MIEIDTKGELSLQKIADSGQTFRWRENEDGWWRIPAFGQVLRAREDGGILTLDCPEEEYRSIWRLYFDLDTDYADIRDRIPESDAYMRHAAEMGRGIRILRQDPWEMTITFIISQRKNIPAIKLCVDKLCRVAGQPLTPDSDIFSFPSPEAILALSCGKSQGQTEGDAAHCSFREAGFESCSLGYRMPYVRAAAAWMEEKQMAEFSKLEDGELKEELLAIRGVGEKVASCIMLFGFHRLNAFPVDVWMKRALSEHYPDGFDFVSCSPYAGIMQQYMFCEARETSRLTSAR